MSRKVFVIVEDIPGYEELYSISREGLVYNWKLDRFLRVTLDVRYLTVQLRKNDDRIKHSIHRLLAITFIPNPNNLPCVDHKDGNSLNNSLDNLRWCSFIQNSMNKAKTTGTSSIYNGVSWDKKSSKWHSRIRHNYKLIHLGFFDDEEEAARAYDTKARELFGEFAKLNFPDDSE